MSNDVPYWLNKLADQFMLNKKFMMRWYQDELAKQNAKPANEKSYSGEPPFPLC